MKLFVDDIRNPPDDSWVVARNYPTAIEYLRTGNVKELSLDHDLGEDKHTGYDIATWIEEQVYKHNFTPPTMHVHSANPVGRKNIIAAIRSIYQQQESRY